MALSEAASEELQTPDLGESSVNELLESKHKMRCKLGHLGQWIEFHSLRHSSGDEEQKSEQ